MQGGLIALSGHVASESKLPLLAEVSITRVIVAGFEEYKQVIYQRGHCLSRVLIAALEQQWGAFLCRHCQLLASQSPARGGRKASLQPAIVLPLRWKADDHF